MAKRGARHNRDSHESYGPDGPRMNPSSSRDGGREGAQPEEQEAKRQERVCDVQDQHQPVGYCAVAGPADNTNGVQQAGEQQ